MKFTLFNLFAVFAAVEGASLRKTARQVQEYDMVDAVLEELPMEVPMEETPMEVPMDSVVEEIPMEVPDMIEEVVDVIEEVMDVVEEAPMVEEEPADVLEDIVEVVEEAPLMEEMPEAPVEGPCVGAAGTDLVVCIMCEFTPLCPEGLDIPDLPEVADLQLGNSDAGEFIACISDALTIAPPDLTLAQDCLQDIPGALGLGEDITALLSQIPVF